MNNRNAGDIDNAFASDRLRKVQAQVRIGFTLVELLVVIAIISMLVAAMLPAVQATRSAARRAQCKSNLLEVSMANQNFEMAQQHYPAGVTDPQPGPIASVEAGLHQAWTISLLPYMDEAALYRTIQREISVYDQANRAVREITIPGFVCPADVANSNWPRSSYAGCHHDVEAPIDLDNSGVFFLNSTVTSDDIRDGLSHTIFLGEKVSRNDDLGWMSGTRATLRNTGTPINVDLWKSIGDVQPSTTQPADVAGDALDNDTAVATGNENELNNKDAVASKTKLIVGGFGSLHGGGAHVAFGNGRIQFMSSGIDPKILRQLGHRDDGQLLNPVDYRE